jgi:hypothetical protein
MAFRPPVVAYTWQHPEPPKPSHPSHHHHKTAKERRKAKEEEEKRKSRMSAMFYAPAPGVPPATAAQWLAAAPRASDQSLHYYPHPNPGAPVMPSPPMPALAPANTWHWAMPPPLAAPAAPPPPQPEPPKTKASVHQEYDASGALTTTRMVQTTQKPPSPAAPQLVAPFPGGMMAMPGMAPAPPAQPTYVAAAPQPPAPALIMEQPGVVPGMIPLVPLEEEKKPADEYDPYEEWTCCGPR